MTAGAYVPLSVSYGDDDRVLDAGPFAELVWVRCLALAGRLWQQDGFLTQRQVDRLVADLAAVLRGHDPVDALVRVGLLRPDGTDPHRPGYRLRSWSEWNRSAEEIAAQRDAKRTGDARRQAERRARLKAKSAEDVTDESRRDVTPCPDVTSRESHPAVQQQQHVSPASAAAIGPPPPLPTLTNEQSDGLGALAKGISAAGLSVSWKLTAPELDRLLVALDRCGVRALVDHAKRRHRPDAPAFSVKAWLEGWEQLPALRLVEAAKPVDCPTHPAAGRRPDGECASCRTDRLTAARDQAEDDAREAERAARQATP